MMILRCIFCCFCIVNTLEIKKNICIYVVHERTKDEMIDPVSTFHHVKRQTMLNKYSCTRIFRIVCKYDFLNFVTTKF